MFAIELLQELIDTGEPTDEWVEASCRDETGGLTELFFSDQIPDIIRAKEICSSCPLLDVCLDGALERRGGYGAGSCSSTARSWLRSASGAAHRKTRPLTSR